MRVRDPISLLFVRGILKPSLRLASEEDTTLYIFGQNVQPDGTLLFADCNNQRVKRLDIQTGALHVAFEEVEKGWEFSNARLLDTRQANTLVVTEGKGRERRVVIAKRNRDGIYLADQTVQLDETSDVCLLELPVTAGEALFTADTQQCFGSEYILTPPSRLSSFFFIKH